MKDQFIHTPGPWFVGKRDRAGGRVFATQHGVDGVVSARIENPANARLIAAAPELLKAALSALEYLEANRPTGNIRDNFTAINQHENGAIKPLRAAIAAATK